MPAQAFFDYKQYDYEHPLFDIDAIRSVNPQRYEMEQLTGVVWVDEANASLIGFKDVSEDEFWCKGHMPDFPLMPGVLQCEAAAQLAGFFARKYNILKAGDYLGFGGMDSVRFRSPVRPPCRLIICARALKVKPKLLAQFEFQGFVDDRLVFNGQMIGVPITRDRSGAAAGE